MGELMTREFNTVLRDVKKTMPRVQLSVVSLTGDQSQTSLMYQPVLVVYEGPNVACK